MSTTYVGYKSITANMDRTLTRIAAEPSTARQSEYFRAHIRDVKSVDDFLKNDKLYRYAMQAFGLDDMIYAKGFMRRILNEGVEGSSALANRLSDSRYKSLAEAFNFRRYGEYTTTFEVANQGTMDRFLRMKIETNAGDQNEGVRLALYFQRKAPEISSAYSILADPALYQVVQTALDLPPELRRGNIDRHADFINSKLKVTDFKSPAKLEKFLQRFSALYDARNAPSVNLSLSTPSDANPGGFGVDLLMALQKLR